MTVGASGGSQSISTTSASEKTLPFNVTVVLVNHRDDRCEPDLFEDTERCGVGRTDCCDETTSAGRARGLNDGRSSLGRIPASVESAEELVGDLRLTDAPITNDEPAVTDEADIISAWSGASLTEKGRMMSR